MGAHNLVDVGDECDRQELRGWGGLSPRYWAVALELQEERLVETHRKLIEAKAGSQERKALFQQLHLEAHFLMIALGHVLESLKVCAGVLGDERIARIRDDFESRAPWLKHFRDVLEHLDDYTLGRGRLQKSGKLDERSGPVLTFGPLERPLEVVLQLGSWRLPLRGAAQGGSRLGRLLAEAWEERFGPEENRVIWGRSGL